MAQKIYDYEATAQELRDFALMNAGHSIEQPQQPKKATGKATLRRYIGKGLKGEKKYENLMYLKDVALVKWKYKQVAKDYPMTKKHLEIVYEYR